MELPSATKTTEKERKVISFRSFSVVFLKLTELIHVNRQCAGTCLSIQIPFRAFRDFPCIPLFLFSLDLLLVLQIQDTRVTGHRPPPSALAAPTSFHLQKSERIRSRFAYFMSETAPFLLKFPSAV